MKRKAATLVLLLSTCSPCAAETAWDVLERFGLTGVWSASCNRPATQTNFREIYSKDSNGIARRGVDFGTGFPVGVTFVESAQIISPSKIKLRVRNADARWGKNNNVITDVVFMKEDDPETKEIFRIRGLNSITSDGRVIVKDGILMSLGKPSFWEYKCRNIPTS
jgi:hypothetical protein